MIIIYSPWIPFRRKFAGWACRWFIWIRLDQMNNHGLLDHEKIHIRQQTELGYHKYLWKYITCQRFRANVEIEAYREAQGMGDKEIENLLVDLYYVEREIAQEMLK